MKLSLLVASITLIVNIAFAYEELIHDYIGGHQLLVKRDHGLPYTTLPSTSCAKPTTCSSISGTVTCRCSDTITTCVNAKGQYCWGSVSLNQTTCPDVPSSCAATLTGTSKNCLCNGKNVLCVDNADNYCYGSIVSGSSVVLTTLKYAPTAAASNPASAAATTIPGMSVISAPSNAVVASPSPTTSDSDKLTTKTMFTLICALTAYIAIH